MRSVVAQERTYWSEQITLGLVCRAKIETVRLISTDYKSCRRFMSSVYVHHGRLDFVVTFWFLIEKSGKYVSIDVSASGTHLDWFGIGKWPCMGSSGSGAVFLGLVFAVFFLDLF